MGSKARPFRKWKLELSLFKTHAHRILFREPRGEGSGLTAQRTNSICNINNGQTLCFPDDPGADELLVNLLSGM